MLERLSEVSIYAIRDAEPRRGEVRSLLLAIGLSVVPEIHFVKVEYEAIDENRGLGSSPLKALQ